MRPFGAPALTKSPVTRPRWCSATPRDSNGAKRARGWLRSWIPRGRCLPRGYALKHVEYAHPVVIFDHFCGSRSGQRLDARMMHREHGVPNDVIVLQHRDPRCPATEAIGADVSVVRLLDQRPTQFTDNTIGNLGSVYGCSTAASSTCAALSAATISSSRSPASAAASAHRAESARVAPDLQRRRDIDPLGARGRRTARHLLIWLVDR